MPDQPTPSSTPRIGIDLTESVFTRMRELEQAGVGAAVPGAIGLLFATCAVHQALHYVRSTTSQAELQRGMVLADMTGEGTQVWYVPQPDCAEVIYRSTPALKANLTELVATYQSHREVVLVMQGREQVELFLIEADAETNLIPSQLPSLLKEKAVHDKGRYPLLARPQMPAPMTLPPGVVSTREALPDGGVCYYFTHEEIGPLGRYVTRTYGAGQTELRAEIFNGEPGESAFRQKLRRDLFDYIVTALNAKMDAALGQAAAANSPTSPSTSPVNVVPDWKLLEDLYGLLSNSGGRRRRSAGSRSTNNSQKKPKKGARRGPKW